MAYIPSSPIQNNAHTSHFYRAEENVSQSISDAISNIGDELTVAVKESLHACTKEMQDIKNLLKDETQKSKQRDEKILTLEKANQELTERLERALIVPTSCTTKNNIFFAPGQSGMNALIVRSRGFGGHSDNGRYARDEQVMLEFVQKFPKKFEIDIKGYFRTFQIAELPEDVFFKVHIGKNGKEIRDTETFKLLRYGKDYTSVEFCTEYEDNNTIWIDIPKISVPPANYEEYVGLDLHVLNIIPR